MAVSTLAVIEPTAPLFVMVEPLEPAADVILFTVAPVATTMFTGALLVILFTVPPAFTFNVRFPLDPSATVTELGFPVTVITAPSGSVIVSVLPSADSVQVPTCTFAVPPTLTPFIKDAFGVLTVKLPVILVPALPVRTDVPVPV